MNLSRPEHSRNALGPAAAVEALDPASHEFFKYVRQTAVLPDPTRLIDKSNFASESATKESWTRLRRRRYRYREFERALIEQPGVWSAIDMKQRKTKMTMGVSINTQIHV